MDKIRTHVLSDENLAVLVGLAREEMRSLLAQQDQQRHALTEQLADMDRRLNRLYEAIETANVDLDDLAPRIRDLKSRRAQVQRALADSLPAAEAKRNMVAGLTTVRSHVEGLRSLLESACFGEQRAFLPSFVSSIDVWPGKILLRYTCPYSRRPKKQETVSSLSIISNGTRNRTILRTSALTFPLAGSPIVSDQADYYVGASLRRLLRRK